MNRSENKQMALDLVEAGTEDSSKERVNKKLPPQVTSKCFMQTLSESHGRPLWN